MDVQDRILKVIEYSNLSRSAFSQKAGMQPQTLHHIVSGRRTNPSFEVLEKIIRSFPEINSSWLITGIGNMMYAYSVNNSTVDFLPEMNPKTHTHSPTATHTADEKKLQKDRVGYERTEHDKEPKYIDIEATKRQNDIIESNKEFFDEYLNGSYSDLKDDNYEYLQIKYYEPMSMHRLKILYGVEIEDLKEVYESHKKLVEVLHYLQPNDFLLEKFPLCPAFKEYFKRNEEDWNEDFEGLKDKKLELILKLVRVKTDREDWTMFLAKLINYMSMYKDFLTYGKTLRDKGITNP